MKKVPIGIVHDTLAEYVSQFEAPVVTLMRVRGGDSFRILVSTILSARTNDKVTAPVTERLFKKVPNRAALAKLSVKQIERLIYPVSFYKTKARHLKLLPAALDAYGGVPRSIEELLTLPGVGRKTANLVMTEAFGEDAICVDTHVHRILNIMGYLRTRTPHETEITLRKKLPRKYWQTINPILVAFGQHHCTPQSPKCSTCPVRAYCNRIGVVRSR